MDRRRKRRCWAGRSSTRSVNAVRLSLHIVLVECMAAKIAFGKASLPHHRNAEPNCRRIDSSYDSFQSVWEHRYDAALASNVFMLSGTCD